MSAPVITQMIASLQYQVIENPGLSPAGTAANTTFSELSQLLNLGASSTPTAVLHSLYKTQLTGASAPTNPYTIDFSGAQSTNGTNVIPNGGIGYKLIGMMVNASSCAADITIKPSVTDAAHAYTMPTEVIKAGGWKFVWFGNTGSMVKADGTHYKIEVSGTAGDSPEISLIFGN